MLSSEFTLYHFYLCPYCKPICYFIQSANLPCKQIHLDLRHGEQNSQKYLQINPFGKVPAIIESNGFVLIESSTILRYLCNTRDVPDHWYPKDPRKRAQVDLFFDWYQIGSQAFAKYFMSRLPFLYRRYKLDPEVTRIELEKALGALEKVFLRERKFLAGEEISLADIQIIFFFAEIELAGYNLSNYPKLEEWKERVLSTNIKLDYEIFISDFKKRIEERLSSLENNKAKL